MNARNLVRLVVPLVFFPVLPVALVGARCLLPRLRARPLFFLFASWNGDLAINAHGVVIPGAPAGLPEERLNLNDAFVPAWIRRRGYAFIEEAGPSAALFAGLAGAREMISCNLGRVWT